MSLSENAEVQLNICGAAGAASDLPVGAVRMRSIYTFEHWRGDQLLWRENAENIVVNQGLNDLLTNYFKGAAYTAAFFVGLKGAGTAVAGDTIASHGGWAEVTGYSDSARPTLTLGSVAGQSVDNSASPALFHINAVSGVTIAGGFVVTSSGVGATGGILYGAADFTNPRTLFNGDTFTVTINLTDQSG